MIGVARWELSQYLIQYIEDRSIVISGDQEQKEDTLNNNTIYSSQNVRVIMSGSRQKLGRVLEVSKNIHELAGVSKNQVIGRSINSLMPPFYRNTHDQVLLKYYERGTSKVLNTNRVVPLLSKENYIVPVWIHARINPNLIEGLSFVGILRRLNEDKYMMIIRENGIIEAYTKNFEIDLRMEDRREDLF